MFCKSLNKLNAFIEIWWNTSVINISISVIHLLEDSFSGESDTLFQMVESQIEIDEESDDDDLDDGNIFEQNFFEKMRDEEFENEETEGVYMNLFCQQSIISFETSQHQTISTELQNAEKKWRKAYFGQPCNMKSPEKVSFDENITVYHLDDFGENRKSEWLEEVADRERFERRIAQCEAVLSTVLKRRLETKSSH